MATMSGISLIMNENGKKKTKVILAQEIYEKKNI